MGGNPVNLNDPNGLAAHAVTHWATQQASYFGNFLADPETARGILEGAAGTSLIGLAAGGDIAAGLPTFGTGSAALAPAASAVAAVGSGLVLDAGQRLAGAASRASENVYYSESNGTNRRAQNPGDVTLPTERAARREAIRQGGGQVSAPNSYIRIENKDKNPNLRGPNNERAEYLQFKNLNGNTVRLDHHKWGHIFDDNNTYEKPHYHGLNGKGHISYD